MRDESRILPFMERLAKQWQSNCPDWRFGQLLINFLSWYGRDPFYLEEKEFEERFNDFIKETFGDEN